MRYADSNCTYTTDLSHGEAFKYYVYRGTCVATGRDVEVRIPAAGLFAYRQGALIQDAFPHLSADEREFLMSGIRYDFEEFLGGEYDDYEDDGQPTEYEEWQDVYGGDDWDHGQYDGDY